MVTKTPASNQLNIFPKSESSSLKTSFSDVAEQALQSTGGMRLTEKNKTDSRGHQFSEMAHGMKIINMPPANKMELKTMSTTGFILLKNLS